MNQSKPSTVQRFLDKVEVVGNKLPDPAVLFIALLFIVWALSWVLSGIDFDAIDPRSGKELIINNQLSGDAITQFFSSMVNNFSHFHPVGVVLVAMLGIGVAEYSGFINAGLRAIMAKTATWLLTPMVILVGIVSHSAIDAGYVLVIPLGGVIFYAAGRHPLAGIAAAFAGVSGGFSANFVPSALDPMLQGISQAGAQLLDPTVVLNPLNNYYFTTASSVVVTLLGWFITDKIVEPKLANNKLDGDLSDLPTMEPLESNEQKALRWALFSIIIGAIILFASAYPQDSAWRAADGSLTAFSAPLMKSIVPFIFLLFLIPGLVYGVAIGKIKSSKDFIEGMSKAMSGMGYYLVIMFFIAQFIYAFGQSNLGILLAVKGAAFLKSMALPSGITITGIIFLTGFINLFVGSASAKWALLAPIFIPMLMQLGISPDLAQAAYRIGDSSTNIITPLMPYFPLVVVFCQRYVSSAGIGTLTAMMLPFSICFLIVWTLFLMLYWGAGIPLGLQASYEYLAN
ncbi:AbgT family transporter [Psychrosphaera sp. 1_MG-2023]|uniref:AbgT family transporter n=1 Tax=Psychrosphaera sp. 1_MG-2023 TaxID=3062643 RepID=UPI0026E3DD69|nr:AbgT family transporter [Psychrosphaera sp. 1_MG-2023]MDO6719929.1 AbgT family transporter [Psychrosphaera sp. 1_MG-2023]